MNSVCSKCGKPVYFAERKTSLGKNWHPVCLRCEQCGKILTPGQHAEHKGLPFCHRPCYAARFGPQMVGYGSNVHSSANYRRSSEHATLYNGQLESLPPKMVFEFNHQTTSTNNNGVNGAQNVTQANKASSEERSQFDSETQELLQKIKQFNSYYEGKKRQSLAVKSGPGDLLIEGPLRIYWGINRPIQLQQFDNVPSNLPETNWRHSFIPGAVPSPQIEPPMFLGATSPVTKGGFDDSIIQTPPDGVVLRKKKIKKFNTVAYRGDSRPDKWKRASINGHTYNFDTRVFTPVQGSCTSVTVDSTFTSTQVIKTLLEKFKIENKPDEYSLYIVQEKGGERLLRNSDIPLLERATLGPDEVSGAKIFLKDKVTTPRKTSVGLIQVKVPEIVVEEEEPPKSPQPRLPEEIEALIAIPEPVLRGILQKFKADEDSDVKKIKARYTVAKRKLVEEIAKIKTKM